MQKFENPYHTIPELRAAVDIFADSSPIVNLTAGAEMTPALLLDNETLNKGGSIVLNKMDQASE